MITANLLVIATISIAFIQEPTPWDKPIIGVMVAEIDATSRKKLKEDLIEQFKDEIRPGFRADMSIGKDGLIVTDTMAFVDTAFRKNDVIKEAQGKPIATEEDFAKFTTQTEPGKEYKINILRPSLVRNRTVFKPMEVKCIPTSRLLMILNLYEKQEDKANKLTHYILKSSDSRAMYLYITITDDGEAYQKIVFQTIHGEFEGLRYVRLVAGEKDIFIARTDRERLDCNTIGAFSREWIDRKTNLLPDVIDFFKDNEEVIMVFGGMDSWRKDYHIAGDVRDNGQNSYHFRSSGWHS